MIPALLTILCLGTMSWMHYRIYMSARGVLLERENWILLGLWAATIAVIAITWLIWRSFL